MKLGLVAGYSPAEMSVPMDLILEAENLGFDSVWTSEAWGSDAVTPAAWILARTSRINVGTAIIQMGARAPACAAMTAMTLDAMSGGRFILGVGPSGPQVIEGWYGVPYGRPLTRTREYISIIRKILARTEPLTHEGEHYQIPYQGEGASGLGKPLRSILHGNPDLRIFTGAFTENGLRTSAEVADGVFPVWMNPDRFDLFESALDEGFARAGNGKSLDSFEIAPFVEVVIDDDLDRARRVVREHLALYIGGMGARTKNFYNDYTKRARVRGGGGRGPGPLPRRSPGGGGRRGARPTHRRRRPRRFGGPGPRSPEALEGGGRPAPCGVVPRPPHDRRGGPPSRGRDPVEGPWATRRGTGCRKAPRSSGFPPAVGEGPPWPPRAGCPRSPGCAACLVGLRLRRPRCGSSDGTPPGPGGGTRRATPAP